MSHTPACAPPRKTDDLFEELEATLCRALVLSDELRRRLGRYPSTTPLANLAESPGAAPSADPESQL